MVMQPSLADQVVVGEDVRASFPATYDRTGPYRTIIEPIASPAAGGNIAWNLATNRNVKLDAFSCLFVTSAVVANRGPVLIVKDSAGNIIWQLGGTAAVVASTSERLFWALSLAGSNNGVNNQANALPEMWLPPGCTLSTITANLDVGDQFSQIVASYRLA